MALDTRFMLAPSLQECFRDKETGLPLRAGFVYFYKDNSRSELKKIYKLTGSPPDYSYTELPNPLQLTAIGTMSDGFDNDILPYYFPYEDDGKTVELYYIRVTDQYDVEQFTRQGFPNISTAEQTSGQDLINYIANGQFLSHYDIAAEGVYEAGEIRKPVTVLGPGNLTFVRPEGSTDKDFVVFKKFGSDPVGVTGNPKYAARFYKESGTSGDAYKDFRVKWPNVNKFSSSIQQYTFGFTGVSNLGLGSSVQIVQIENFGTPDGDAPTETVIGTINILDFENFYSISFVFGSNSGKTLGSNNDDYVELAIRFPLTGPYDIEITDLISTPGAVTLTQFPTTTDAKMFSEAISGNMPTPPYDGSDLYLPLIRTPDGVAPDYSEIGKIYMLGHSQGPATNEMYCDGARLEYIAYAENGIPYKRLGDKLWNNEVQAPEWGTGPGYFISAVSGAIINLWIVNNSTGATTDATDGTIPTNFTIDTLHEGVATAPNDYNVRSYLANDTEILVENKNIGIAAAPTAGTSGFTIALSGEPGTTITRQRFTILTTNSAALAGKYFTFTSGGTNYAVWFKVNNIGVAPSVPGHTLILVKLYSDYDAQDVAQVVCWAMNGWHITSIRPTAASSLTAGSWINLNASNGEGGQNEYYLWFKKDGVGTDPKPSGRIAIEADVAADDTIQDVVKRMREPINRKYFAVPDSSSVFFRSKHYSNRFANDPGARLSYIPGFTPFSYGTYELDFYQGHKHPGGTANIPQSNSTGPTGGFITGPFVGEGTLTLNIPESGGVETRPSNLLLDFVIKY